MATQLEIYKCEVCGNIVEVLHGGAGQLVCCNEPMILLKENTTDAARSGSGCYIYYRLKYKRRGDFCGYANHDIEKFVPEIIE